MNHTPLCLLLWVGVATAAQAEVKLPAIFSDHMVLQREVPVPVWGTAAPDEKVVVRFLDQEVATSADKVGKWSIKLAPLKAGGPHEMTVAGRNTLTIKDVLVGEVWLGSGQSNMGVGMSRAAEYSPAEVGPILSNAYPRIRLSGGGSWSTAEGRKHAGYSAILFMTGLRIHEATDVPVGPIVCAAGGSFSGPWLPPDAIARDATCQQAIVRYRDQEYPVDLRAEA